MISLHNKRPAGFTLIELLVVFAFIGILTSLGLASYSSFNGSQALSSSVSDISTLLDKAKSNAIAQVIPGSCAGGSLSGYGVDFFTSQYTLYAVCGTKSSLLTDNLPSPITIVSGSAPTVFFRVSTGTVPAPATITLSGYGKTKTITVSSTGDIQIQ